MPVKAGKFTLRAGDMLVHGGAGSNSGFEVGGIGFEPSLTIVMSVGLSTENTWAPSGKTWGVMCMHSHNPDDPVNVGGWTGLTEFWDTDMKPSSFWSNSGVGWFKNGHGGGGYAIYIAEEFEDGFRIGYPGGGYEGGYGTVCYYLCIGSDDRVGHTFSYQGAPQPEVVGWEPNIFMTLCSGGLDQSAGDIAFADMSVPSWGFGGIIDEVNSANGPQWLANGLAAATSVEQQRFIDDGFLDQEVFDGNIVAQQVGNASFFYTRSDTTFGMHFNNFFAGDNIRGGAHFLENGLYSGGSRTPNPVGVPLDVTTGFTPECVVFLCPQDHHDSGGLGVVPWGGRCFGFLTDDFECCIAWGAYSHIGPTAAFCTSDFSWLSNFTSTQLNAVGSPNYGNAEITSGGFRMTTQAMPKFNKYVRYAAFGLDQPHSQFFRVL